MTTSTERESATIYQFPARGRFAASTRQESRPDPTPRVVVGGWYHDEAIREERVRQG